MAEKSGKLPNRIRELRKQKGWTLEQLAFEAGMSTAYLGQFETGVRDLNDRYAKRISHALGVPQADLLKAKDLGFSEEELHLRSMFRAASPDQRETLLRVAEGLTGYRAEPAETDAPATQAEQPRKRA